MPHEYHVVPDSSGSGWKVTNGHGGTVSNHRKKSRAKQRARREASDGDMVYIHRQDGTVQNKSARKA